MATTTSTSGLFAALLEIVAVMYLRFAWILRFWVLLLMIANLAGVVIFPGSVEVWVMFGLFLFGSLIMGYLYQQNGGFTALLGLGHAPWLILVPWLAVRIANMEGGGNGDSVLTLKQWLLFAVVIDTISLLVDIKSLVAYMKGKTEPTYYWDQPSYESIGEAEAPERTALLADQSEKSIHSTYSV